MASHKVNVAKKIGNFTVMATSVAVRELYVIMVLSGEEVWDIQATESVEEARTMYEQFVNMCNVFEPHVERLQEERDSGIETDVESLAKELANDYEMIVKAQKTYIH